MHLVSTSVASLLGWRAVIPQFIRLHDEAKVRPEEVHAEAVHHPSRLRQRQPGQTHEREESPLELGIGHPESVAIKELKDGAGAGLAAHRLNRRSQSLRIDQIEAVGLVDRGFELCGRESRREVDQRPSRAGHGDPETNPAITGRKRTAPVHTDSRRPSPGSSRHGYLDRAAAGSSDSPEFSCAVVTQQGALTTREHRSHHAFQPPNLASPDDEHPAMKAAEALGPQSMRDAALGQSEIEELVPCDDAVLATDQPPDLALVLTICACYSGPKWTKPRIRPPSPADFRPWRPDAGGGSRTHTSRGTRHFECRASAIPPLRRTATIEVPPALSGTTAARG
jgi:hypothetical protein